MIEAAARNDPRIRAFACESRGIAEALRTGCKAARGEFVARMDADDWMAPERLSKQIAFIERHPGIGVVSYRVRHGGDRSEQAGYAAHVAWINSLLTPDEIDLRRFGVSISGFIDVDPKKLGRLPDGRAVVGPRHVPSAERTFILAVVSARGARELIRAELDRAGRAEGDDYLLVA